MYKLLYLSIRVRTVYRHFGTKTLWHQDTSAPVPKCPDISAPVPKCPSDSLGHFGTGVGNRSFCNKSVLVLKCPESVRTVVLYRLGFSVSFSFTVLCFEINYQ